MLEAILAREETDVLVFSLHAMGYDPTREGFPFYNVPVDYFGKLDLDAEFVAGTPCLADL